jgi:hypothetical protein
MSDFELRGGALYSHSGQKVGELDSNRFRDSHGSTVGSIDGSDIRDASWRKVGTLDGNHIRDGDGRGIATLDDAKKSIRNATGGASLAGFYLLFIR